MPADEPAPRPESLTYAQAGVDIDAGDLLARRITSHMRRTYNPRVLGRDNAFAGCFRLDYNEKLFARNYRDPVLVACTDGVGTKVKIALALGAYDTLGQDLVAMSVNDLIVQGAEPLFFLDYLAVHKLDPGIAEQLVKGVADACQASDCALLGGETAEMPDLYSQDDFDMAGFAVGVAELNRLIDGSRTQEGDVILGLASSGVHSNGFSLVRRIVDHAGLDLNSSYPELETERTLGQVLLEPTRLYARPIVKTLRHYTVKQVVSAMSHITGGGLPGNLPRVLPENLDARIDPKAWPVPPIFRFLQKHGNVAEDEMFRVFNMGIGFAMIVRPYFADAIAERLSKLGQEVHQIGQLTEGKGQVVFS